MELGIADAATLAEAVASTAAADLLAGEFSGVVPTAGLASGTYRVWARSCLGDICGPAAPVTVTVDATEPRATSLALTLVGRGNDTRLRAQLTDVGSPPSGVAGRTVDFYADGELIGSQPTDVDGAAAIAVPSGYRGAHRLYQAVFAGDDTYRAASAYGTR